MFGNMGMLKNFDPKMLMKLTQVMQRLPKSQLHQMQTLVQQAMAGKDVSREMAQFQKTLPPQARELLEMLSKQVPQGEVGSDALGEKKEGRFSKIWKKVTGKETAETENTD